MIINQIFLVFTGVIAIYLSQSGGKNVKYACLFGLAGQPFWFYSAYTAEQWGIFILCFFYSFAWLKGLKIHWLSGKKNDEQ